MKASGTAPMRGGTVGCEAEVRTTVGVLRRRLPVVVVVVFKRGEG